MKRGWVRPVIVLLVVAAGIVAGARRSASAT